jgi:hypothetical protein
MEREQAVEGRAAQLRRAVAASIDVENPRVDVYQVALHA